jgi:hypothetical protein
MKRLCDLCVRILDLLRLIQDDTYLAGLLKKSEAPLFGFQDFIVGEIKAGRAVECEKIRVPVLPEKACLKVGVRFYFIGPVLHEAALGYDQHRIDGAFLEPGEREVESDLGLAKTLFMKEGGIFEAADSLDRLNLIQERLMARVQSRFALEKKHLTRSR